MDHFLNFVIGGGIIALTLFLAEHLNTKFAALAYAFPTTLSITLIFAYFRHDLSTVSNLAQNTGYGLMFTVGFALIIGIFTPRIGFWLAFSLAILSFGGCGWLFLRYFR